MIAKVKSNVLDIFYNHCNFIGYVVRPSRNGEGSELGYVSHTDPHGKLPVWLVNKVTQIFAPKVILLLHSNI